MWKSVVDYREHAGVFLARNPYEKDTFKVKWNREWNTWALATKQHVLIAVSEVWIEGDK